MMSQIFFKDKKGRGRACDFNNGDTLLTVARRHGIDIEGACEGAMTCATCHVKIAPEWAGRLPAAGESENALLDIAVGVGKNSRLGCQIILAAALDGMTVFLT